eukprot:3794115-Lingulodinium_polyedra.AAC.1
MEERALPPAFHSLKCSNVLESACAGTWAEEKLTSGVNVHARTRARSRTRAHARRRVAHARPAV